MRSPWRTGRSRDPGGGTAPGRETAPGRGTALDPRTLLDPKTLRDIGLVCLADAIVGASFGATTVAGGLPAWVPVVMSLIIWAGGAQFAAVGIVIAGGGPVAAVAAGALLNTRLVPYGFAVADITAGRWWTRLLGAQLTTDETVAFALGQPDRRRRAAAFWTCGALLFTSWNVAVALGAAAGTLIGNTGAFGLDTMFPAVMLALAMPALTGRRRKAAGIAGAAAAVALTPVLPAGLPVLAGLSGLAVMLPRRRAAHRAASQQAAQCPPGNPGTPGLTAREPGREPG